MMLNVAAATLIQMAAPALRDVDRSPVETAREALLRVAEADGSFIYEDIKLARLLVEEVGVGRAVEMAAAYYAWPAILPPGQALFEEYRAAWESEPFGDPNLGDFFARAAELGVTDFFEGAIYAYLPLAPVPHHTPEQAAEIGVRVEAAMRLADRYRADDEWTGLA